MPATTSAPALPGPFRTAAAAASNCILSVVSDSGCSWCTSQRSAKLQGGTFSISALFLSIKVPYSSYSWHKNEKVTHPFRHRLCCCWRDMLSVVFPRCGPRGRPTAPALRTGLGAPASRAVGGEDDGEDIFNNAGCWSRPRSLPITHRGRALSCTRTGSSNG
eukprot:SAG31_NODE_343_length_17426_cov_35.294443_14_plen_162_part_00